MTVDQLVYELAKFGVKHGVHEMLTPSRLYSIEYRDGHLPDIAVMASSATWGELAACNLARAYRPELP